MILADRTWPEAADLVRKTGTVLVPVGAFEAHGLHLPLSTDADTAWAVARRAGELAGVPVAPLLPVGVSQLLRAFPGTLTLSAATYASVIRELAESVFRWGAERVLFVNAHGGNNRVLQETLSQLYLDYAGRKLVAMVHCLGLLGEIWPGVRDRSVGHSDFRETAIMLALKPETVHVDRASQPEAVAVPLTERLTARHGGRVDFGGAGLFLPRGVAEWAPSAGWGDLADATGAVGQEILETLATYVARFIAEFRKVPLEAGRPEVGA